MSCNTAEYDICVDQGADLLLPIPVSGIGLTDATAKMQVRESVTSPTVIIELTTENGRIDIDGQVITLSLSDTDTASFEKQYVYDLFVVQQDGTKLKILKGNINLDLSVTRW